MRDDICTIPVSEVFEQTAGCPLCRMTALAEERILTYILGDAMMEPDVRIATNKQGFCTDHLDKMADRRGRLQLALMLQTHLAEIEKGIFDKKLFSSPDKKARQAEKLSESCFICNKLHWGIDRMLETVYRCYETERDFRTLFAAQEYICLPHFERLTAGLDKHKCPHYGSEMKQELVRLSGNYAAKLTADLDKYCRRYDYRSDNTAWGDEKTAVERSIAYLTGRTPKL